MAMMVSLQRRLDEQTADSPLEQTFYSSILRYLSTKSGRHIEIQDWMITSYDVEFGYEIGSGGLYVFERWLPNGSNSQIGNDSGKGFKGTWNKMPVALKVLKDDRGMAPSSTVSLQIYRYS
jgi:hypothetical protein